MAQIKAIRMFILIHCVPTLGDEIAARIFEILPLGEPLYGSIEEPSGDKNIVMCNFK